MTVVKRDITVTTPELNRNGYRVLPEGCDLRNYKKNPIVLYNHDMRQVLGTAINVRLEDNKIKFDGIDFDDYPEGHPLYMIAKQFEKGTLRTVSLGHLPQKTSSDPKDMVTGQNRRTVLETEVIEISVTPIPANASAVALRKTESGDFEVLEGELLNECLPLLTKTESLEETEEIESLNQTNERSMNFKNIAFALKLSESACEADIIAEINRIRKYEESAKTAIIGMGEITGIFNNQALKTQIESLTENNPEMAMNMLRALRENAKTQNPVTETLDNVRPSQWINLPNQSITQTESVNKNWDWYCQHNEQALIKMETEKPNEYIRLYKEKYGIAPQMT